MYNFLINDPHFLRTFSQLLTRTGYLKLVSLPDQWKDAFQILYSERVFLIGLLTELVKKLLKVTQTVIQGDNNKEVKKAHYVEAPKFQVLKPFNTP